MIKETVGKWIRIIAEVSPRLARLLLLAAYPFPRLYIFVSRRSKMSQLAARRVWRVRNGPLAGFELRDLLPDEIAPVIMNKMEIQCSTLLGRLQLTSQIVLDVGGCYGYYALLLSRLVGEGGRVYSFEPDWHTFGRLTRNLAINNSKNVDAAPLAVSNLPFGLAKWYSSDDEPWNSKLADDQAKESQGLAVVPVTSLDYFAATLEIIDKIRLIKIDVEGGELNVLQGATQLLVRSKPLILCELHGTEIAEQVFAFLSEQGYQREMIEYMSETRQHILAFPSREAERYRALISESLG